MRNYKSLETHHDFYKGVESINHVKTASDNFVFKSKRKVRVTEEPHQPWDALSPFTCTADCPYFTRIFNWKYASRLADENLRYQITLICVESPLLNLKRSPNLVSHTELEKTCLLQMKTFLIRMMETNPKLWSAVEMTIWMFQKRR